jgi:hypothetical protein
LGQFGEVAMGCFGASFANGFEARQIGSENGVSRVEAAGKSVKD